MVSHADTVVTQRLPHGEAAVRWPADRDAMTSFKVAVTASAVILLMAGCGGSAPTSPTAAANSAPEASASASPAPAEQSPTPASNAPDGLLQAIKANGYADHDQLVFEFGGKKVSVRRIEFVSEVREDPSDRLVKLVGTSFLTVVFDGTLDTAPRESDPGKAQKYAGPTTIAPGLPVLKEVAVAGDFEFVLSFGVGMGTRACVTAKTHSAPARLVLDFWPDSARQPADAGCSGTIKVQR